MLFDQTNNTGVANAPPARMPLTLCRKRIRLRPTRYGVMLFFLLLAMLLGSINYRNNLGFLVTFLIASMACVSILYTYKNMTGITIMSFKASPVFAGSQAVFEVSVHGQGIERSAISFAFLGQKETPQSIGPNIEKRIYMLVNAVSRGVLRPGPLRVFSVYPLGIFCARCQIDLALECLVYPKPLALGIMQTAERSSAANEGNHKGPGVDDFQGLKAYSPGDPLQRISWKASSRGQGLFTKDFTGQFASSAVFDWYTLTDSNGERKLSHLCYMIIRAHQLNIEYGLRLPGLTIDPNRGERHKRYCLKALAQFSLP